MVYELPDPSRAQRLFAHWEHLETAVTACLQGMAGKIYVTDPENPRSAMAHLGTFVFYAGEPERELVLGRPKCFLHMVPENEAWAKLIVTSCPAQKRARYALKKNAEFDRERLKSIAGALPEGYEIKRIDDEVYDLCLKDEEMAELVYWFGPKDKFLTLGRGFAVIKDGSVVSGAASAYRYREGIEIEADTVKGERHRGLASAAAAALILSCLNEGLYPSWDAANWMSVMLAQKLGYEYSHEYFVYCIA